MFTTAEEIVRRRTGPNTRRCAHSCAWLPLTEWLNGYCSKVKMLKSEEYLCLFGTSLRIFPQHNQINLSHPSGEENVESVSLASGPITFVVTILAALVVVFVGVRGNSSLRSVGSEVKTCFSAGKIMLLSFFNMKIQYLSDATSEATILQSLTALLLFFWGFFFFYGTLHKLLPGSIAN